MTTRQQIIDRLEKLGKEHGEAYRIEQERQEKERAAIQRECGELGHFYAKPTGMFSVFGDGRECVFCKAKEAEDIRPIPTVTSQPHDHGTGVKYTWSNGIDGLGMYRRVHIIHPDNVSSPPPKWLIRHLQGLPQEDE